MPSNAIMSGGCRIKGSTVEQKDRFYSFDNSELGVDADFVVLPHRSGQNAKLWKRLGYEHRSKTILETLRKAVASTLGNN
jgi:hypothetical protein